MRIVHAIFWGIVGAIAGAVDGAAFGWALQWPLMDGAQVGAALAGGAGLVYGFFRGSRSPQPEHRGPETKYNLEPCAWCRGTGVEGKSQKQCSVCFGQGQLLVKHPSTTCPKCKGKGQTLLRRRCNVCQGAGWANYAHLDSASARRWR